MEYIKKTDYDYIMNKYHGRNGRFIRRDEIFSDETGILVYESECIKINTNKMVISFSGRGLCVKCITNSCVEVAGFITGIEFMTWGDFYDA